ncbi:MAG TPA: OmpA family protein, partial [Dysgonamonadaceae bacterium]|nr:OmpA family protein [Dysgonamonadaceae bacterium]
DRHTATFNFVVNRYELLRDYKNNRLKFEEVDKIIKEIASNEDVEITEFNIAGYASPEGSASHNKMLAERRADAFANYLVTKFNVSKDKFMVESFGEDWNGLIEAVESSTITDKDEILNIIATIDNVDARDEPLKKLSNGTTYRTLLDDFYPQLRRTEYTIAYIVRSFDVEEAKEIIKTNPKLLSLNEMYMVAHSYGADTPEFKEVFDIAVRMYPDSEIAILNSAAADIENNAFDRAINQMQKLNDNPKAWNNLGVAYALKGDLQKASELFDRAAKANDADAVRNLERLEKYLYDVE